MQVKIKTFKHMDPLMEEKKPRFKNPILLGNFGLFFVRSCYYIREAIKKTMSVKIQNDILQVEEQSNN